MIASTLEADHRQIDDLYAAALAALESGSRAAALIRVDLFWARLAMHIRAEHLHLFPAVKLAAGDEAVERLRGDHDLFMKKLARAMKLLRASESDEEPNLRAAISILRELGPALDEHNRFEERTVYARDAAHLTEAEREELARSIEKEITNMPPRFSSAARTNITR